MQIHNCSANDRLNQHGRFRMERLASISRWQFVGLLLCSAGLTLAGVLVLPLVLQLIPENRFQPEIALTLLIVSGVVVFIAAFLLGVAIFALFGLADRAQPFGMPEGTVRAVIALM